MELLRNTKHDEVELQKLGVSPDLSEIAWFGQLQGNKAPFKIDDVVKIRGDKRPGHRLFPHPFPARMPLEVAMAAIEGLTKPGDLVLDPMSGSGVVSKAALSLGRRAIAVDIDPLAVVQSRALCSSLDPNTFEATANSIRACAVNLLTDQAGIETLWTSLDVEGQRFLDYWFPRSHVDELLALSMALDEIADPSEWPIYATLISSLIISKGSGASLAMDLSRSRPHRVATKKPSSPFTMWSRQVAAFRRYYERSGCIGNPDIRVGDARELDIPDESIDAIVTSPPYLNAIDYIRTSKFSLVFFGKRLAELRSIRAHSVGTETGLASGVLDSKMEAMVEKGVSDPKRRPLVRRYVHDMRATLAEAHRVLKPGGKALYVMGPSILSRRDYDAAEVLMAIAKAVGFHPLGYGRRDICTTRRSLPPPRRSARAESINRRMTCEFYIALSKVE